MLAMVQSCAVVGLDGALVQVEVDLATGLPAFTIVGLPDAAVNEAKERVRAAIRNSGLAFPLKRITVNLAPADIRKEGPSYDLPMAVGVLRAGEQIVFDDTGCLFLGELGLDGALRHTNGILPMVALARDHGITTVFVPAVDAAEAALVEGMTIIPVESLAALVGHLRGETPILPALPLALDLDVEPTPAVDLSAVRGQEHVKRALEVAAAGGHNVIMSGAPGAGKTLLARLLPGILPQMTLVNRRLKASVVNRNLRWSLFSAVHLPAWHLGRRHIGEPIEGGDDESHPDAAQLRGFARPVHVGRPVAGCTAIDFHGLISCGNQDVFLHAGTGLVERELVGAVVPFGRVGEHLDSHAGRPDFLHFSPVVLAASNHGIGESVLIGRETNGHIGVINATSAVPKLPPKILNGVDRDG